MNEPNIEQEEQWLIIPDREHKDTFRQIPWTLKDCIIALSIIAIFRVCVLLAEFHETKGLVLYSWCGALDINVHLDVSFPAMDCSKKRRATAACSWPRAQGVRSCNSTGG